MKAVAFYGNAKRRLLNEGCAAEINWQAGQNPDATTECDFLRESAWVIYCSGFREATVRRYFDYLSLCFFDWTSSKAIASSGNACVMAAMNAMRNRRKHEAIVTVASHVAKMGFEVFKRQLIKSPIETLQGFPFLGPVTSIHLAKNLGFDLAKPDRHLVRLKDHLGFNDVEEMCRSISSVTGDPLKVVDLVLWRYLERHGRFNEWHRMPEEAAQNG